VILTCHDIRNLHKIFELINLFNIKIRTIFTTIDIPRVQRYFEYGDQLSGDLHFSVYKNMTEIKILVIVTFIT
jgi:hypothetical protein